MKTEALIDLLATGAGPVQDFPLARRFARALALGAAVTCALFLALFRLNPALADLGAAPDFWIKMMFTGAMAVAGLMATARLARPGMTVGAVRWLAVAPLLAMWTLAAVTLVEAAPAVRAHLVLGSTWRVCALNIAALSVPMLVAGVWALRGLAPTDLRLAGAALGLFAGAFAACLYGLHCPELAAPFLAVWYVIGMFIPSLLGWAVGPRLLRW